MELLRVPGSSSFCGACAGWLWFLCSVSSGSQGNTERGRERFLRGGFHCSRHKSLSMSLNRSTDQDQDQDQDPPEELQSLGWFHQDLSRHAAEALLLSNGSDGSYLLRTSNQGPDRFALSVRGTDSVRHFHVTRGDNGYVFGFNQFRTLQDFVDHFANQPLLGSDAGTLIVLKSPYPWRVEEPSIYESVRVHTAVQTGRTVSQLVPSAASLGTKEGYLVKLGAIVKNWKQRWFTLHRQELKYFKDRASQEPIRTLDLRACSAVQFDYSQDRVNCFCLVFPDRTFFLCARSAVEADEWIRILQWKLSQTRRGR